MKTYRKCAALALALAVLMLLTACGGSPEAGDNGGAAETDNNGSQTEQETNNGGGNSSAKWFTDPRPLSSGESYESSEYYLHNTITGRHVYCVETKPTGLAAGEKVPVVIYVHGGSGNATNFAGIYTELAKQKIAAFSFECCGGNRSGAKSEGSKLFSSHYTSRITDLETALAKVKTLDYVDTSRIFFFGESYGGIVVSFDAADHPEIAGLILLSTGMGEDGAGMLGDNGSETYVKEYDKENHIEAIKSYKGDVICFNGDKDNALEGGRYQIGVYNTREGGATAVFYEMENSEHSYSAFSPESREFVIKTMGEFVLSH